MLKDQEKSISFHRLVEHRDTILSILEDIKEILKKDFPKEFEIAYQYWIPQIKTAIVDDEKWLNRSDYSLTYTLNKIAESEENSKAKSNIKKFL